MKENNEIVQDEQVLEQTVQQEQSVQQEDPFIWALNTVFNGVYYAQSKGVYNLDDAARLHQAMLIIKQQVEGNQPQE